MTVPGVTFGQADTLSNEFQNDPIDGIIGLAFQSAAVDNVLPPLNQAIQDGLLGKFGNCFINLKFNYLKTMPSLPFFSNPTTATPQAQKLAV